MPSSESRTITVSSICMPSGSSNQRLWNAPRSSTVPVETPRSIRPLADELKALLRVGDECEVVEMTPVEHLGRG